MVSETRVLSVIVCISIKVFDDFDDVIKVCAVFSRGESIFFVVEGVEELELVFVETDPDLICSGECVVHGCFAYRIIITCFEQLVLYCVTVCEVSYVGEAKLAKLLEANAVSGLTFTVGVAVQKVDAADDVLHDF